MNGRLDGRKQYPGGRLAKLLLHRWPTRLGHVSGIDELAAQSTRSWSLERTTLLNLTIPFFRLT
jgi:hypothetical protein